MSKKEVKITKQFIIDQLDGNEADLSMNELDTVPVKELASVTRCTKLDISRNRLKSLPDNFGLLRHLVGLDLSNNQLKTLPDSFGQLVLLQKLDLYSNQLTSLPLTFWQLKKLTWLDLKGNPLEAKLAEAAGTCVSPKDCQECASRVINYVKQQSSQSERMRQNELEKQREQERIKKLEAKKKREAMKREKELRRRKKEEEEAEQQLKERAENEVEVAGCPSPIREEWIEPSRSTILQSSWFQVGCLCTSIVLISLIFMLCILLGISLCHIVLEPSSCKALQLALIKKMAGLLELFGAKVD